MPYATVVDVMLLLAHDGQLLMSQRAGTGYCDQMWNAPSGKLEQGEDAATALVREAEEELGIRIDPNELQLAGVVHVRNPEGQGRLGLFFATDLEPSRHGHPYNAEPHKCAGLSWYPPETLPPNTVPYTTAGVNLYLKGETFTTLGWDSPPW